MIRRHVLSCAGLKGGDASDNGEGGCGGNKRRNDVGSGNNLIDVDLGVLEIAEWIKIYGTSTCSEII